MTTCMKFDIFISTWTQAYYIWKKKCATEEMRNQEASERQNGNASRIQRLSEERRRQLEEPPLSSTAFGALPNDGSENDKAIAQKGTNEGKISSTISDVDKQQLKQAMEQMFTRGSTETQASDDAGGLQSARDLASKDSLNVAQPQAPVQGFHPERTTYEWIPAPLLCKRFNVSKPDKARLEQRNEQRNNQNIKGYQVDRLALQTQGRSHMQFEAGSTEYPHGADRHEKEDSHNTKQANQEQTASARQDPLDELLSEALESSEQATEKPLDLYSAIFDEDSDNDE